MWKFTIFSQVEKSFEMQVRSFIYVSSTMLCETCRPFAKCALEREFTQLQPLLQH